MRFDTSQQMKLGQQMKLAPRMIQSMEILQLPTLALEERIEQELESNVTLEAVEPVQEEQDGPDGGGGAQEDRPEGARELDVDADDGASDFERLASMEGSYSEAFENEYSAAGLNKSETFESRIASSRQSSGERDAKMDAMANTAARGASFSEQLLEQWGLADLDDRTREAGELLISFIDDDGYLRTDLEKIADRAPAGEDRPSAERLEEVLKVLQSNLEPIGVGARDTRECLLLQLGSLKDELDRGSFETTRLLISEHLDDLVRNRLPRIAQKTDLSIEQIKDAMVHMQRLNVAPGRALRDETPPPIIPDAVIEYDEDEDRYFAYLNDGRLPHLRINDSYAKMAKEQGVAKETKEFVRRNLTNAQWLIEAIAQRNNTLMRVINVVIAAQRDFFDFGPQALKPLPMTQVADQLGVHVATVSRAVSGKYVETPRGVVALRRFFSGGTQTDSGEDMSWDAIRAALQEIVDAEDKSAPLSDEALAEALKERGVDIARRTVAKYRAQLDIPSARMRRQY